MERRGKFKSRRIEMSLDIIAVINHLEDNLDGKPILVKTIIAPIKKGMADYSTRKRTGIRWFKITKESDIYRLQNFLLERWAIRKIDVSIVSNKK